ncbi:MAG: alpha/beta hydrolase [Chlorobi bacterium]|nr:alpha/beta hydrolase [Chlorobiota bacterium]
MLVAGLASDSQSWQPIVKDLSRHYRVITFDNRGAGRTRPQNIETSIQDIAGDCIALIRHLGLSSVNLLGHSMGGFVALDCAIRYPEYVSKLILAGTSAFNSERNNALFHDWISYIESGMNPELWFRNIFYWIFSKRFFEDKEALNTAIRFAMEYPYPQTAIAFKNQVNAIKEFNCTGNLPGITSKTMVICGKEDLLFPPEESARVLQAIPEALFAFVEQAAHSIHVEKPGEFVNLVQKFVESD